MVPLNRPDLFATDAGQAARHEPAQEAQPGRTVLARADVDAQHLAFAVAVDGRGYDDAHLRDAALLAHELGEGAEPDVAVRAAIEGPLDEARADLVRFGAGERCLALRDAIPNLRRACRRSALGSWLVTVLNLRRACRRSGGARSHVCQSSWEGTLPIR